MNMVDPEFEQLLEASSLGAKEDVVQETGERIENPRVKWRHDPDHAYLNVTLIGRVGKLDLFTIAHHKQAGDDASSCDLAWAFGYDLRDEIPCASIDAAKERAEREVVRLMKALGARFTDEKRPAKTPGHGKGPSTLSGLRKFGPDY